MKSYKANLLWILVAICIATVSCKKEEVEEQNKFTLRDTTHVTTHGYISKFSTTESQSRYMIYLCSNGLNCVNNKLYGKGDYVRLMITSDSPDQIIPGLYVYNVNMSGSIYLNQDTEANTSNRYLLDPVLSSTADVKVVDNIYEIEYKYTLSTGEVVKGKFNGALESFVYTLILIPL
jgi:hypothetical protein